MHDQQITFESIYEKLEKQDISQEYLTKITESYNFAKKEHAGYKRLSGDDYITHPLHVTNILIDLNVDETTIIAALLHEVLNNGHSATYEEVEAKFGSDVAKIVESISKINKLELVDNKESSAIYLRKVLVGLAEDPRVLYIKLADRLHNMRTNWAIKKEEQKQKAEETMSVLVPIAHRLGINSIKSELEDICLKILKPDVYQDILETLNKTTTELNDNLLEMQDNITNLLTENNINHKIKGRVKSVYSIYNKLSSGKKYSDIYDILALRIFVNKESDCYQVIGLIHSKYRPIPKRFKDYIANPKMNMYQSLHTTIFGSDGSIYEVQVRTYEMDEIAEKGIASHWSYKEKGTKKVQALMEQKLEMFRSLIESYQEDNDLSFASAVKDNFLAKSIYVFTPKGDVIELPQKATPIDFAYRIHSHIGDTTVGAIVNDNIVPLSYELQDNDIIKIITNQTSTPSETWLNFVKTSQAKNKIKAFFNKKDRNFYVDKGKNILEKELRKQKLSFNTIMSLENTKKILQDLKLDNLEELYFTIGNLRFTPSYIIKLATQDKQTIPDMLIEKIKIKDQTASKNNAILIDDKKGLTYSLAKCCNPIKGDAIRGFVTSLGGVRIHKKDCINNPEYSNREVKVTWNEEAVNKYLTKLNLLINNLNILPEILMLATKENIQIVEMKNIEDGKFTRCSLVIKVIDTKSLEHFQNKLQNNRDIKII